MRQYVKDNVGCGHLILLHCSEMASVSVRCPRCQGKADWRNLNIFENAEL